MKTKFKINNIYGSLLFECEAETLKDAVVEAVRSGANLSGADLSGADLSGAYLHGAYLSGAYLFEANLFDANLFEANLFEANLSGANLSESYLPKANLSRANLSGANLSEANLSEANLSGAYLSGADLSGASGVYPIVPEVGSFIGFKKLSNGVIAKLLIPEDAERVGGFTGRKCRASKAIVLEGEGQSKYDPSFIYVAGQTVVPSMWDSDPRVECSNGIHFFITRKEAEEYN